MVNIEYFWERICSRSRPTPPGRGARELSASRACVASAGQAGPAHGVRSAQPGRTAGRIRSSVVLCCTFLYTITARRSDRSNADTVTAAKPEPNIQAVNVSDVHKHLGDLVNQVFRRETRVLVMQAVFR